MNLLPASSLAKGRTEAMLASVSNSRSCVYTVRGVRSGTPVHPVCAVGRGFGKSSQKQKRTGSNWKKVGTTSDLFAAGKDVKVITVGGDTLMLYKYSGKVYCSQSNSTAFKFPLTDAKLFEGEEGAAVRVPLDGTSYDLTTGKVLEWCPKSANPLRWVLGSLKASADQEPLQVYPADLEASGDIYVQYPAL